MKKLVIFSLALATLGVACSPFNVRSDYATTADFRTFKTYKLRIDDLKINDIDKDRVLNEISKQLQAKGLSVGENPDLIVNVSANHKNITDVQTSPYGNFWGNPWGFGVGFGHSWTFNRTEGGLTIDLIDAKTQKLVWQGIGSGISVDSPKRKQSQIPAIIAEILKNYPPAKN